MSWSAGRHGALAAARRLAEHERADRGVAHADAEAGDRPARRRRRSRRRSRRGPRRSRRCRTTSTARPALQPPPAARAAVAPVEAGLQERADAPAQRRDADHDPRLGEAEALQLGQRERHERVAAEEGDREQAADEDARTAGRARPAACPPAAARAARGRRARARRARAARPRAACRARARRGTPPARPRAARRGAATAAPRPPLRRPAPRLRSPGRVSTTATGRKGRRKTNTQRQVVVSAMMPGERRPGERRQHPGRRHQREHAAVHLRRVRAAGRRVGDHAERAGAEPLERPARQQRAPRPRERGEQAPGRERERSPRGRRAAARARPRRAPRPRSRRRSRA